MLERLDWLLMLFPERLQPRSLASHSSSQASLFSEKFLGFMFLHVPPEGGNHVFPTTLPSLGDRYQHGAWDSSALALGAMTLKDPWSHTV